MRVRKHRVKHYTNIIKKYYFVDEFWKKLNNSLHSRLYPESALNKHYRNKYSNEKSKYKKKYKKSKFESRDDYKNFIPYRGGRFIGIPIVYYNPNKRSRIKNVVNSYRMCSISELNEKLGTNYTELDLENLSQIYKNF